MARISVSRNIIPVYAMIIAMHIIAQAEGTCVVEPDFNEPKGLRVPYPYGTYIYTCDNNGKDLFLPRAENRERQSGVVAMDCFRNGATFALGGKYLYNSFLLSECCVTCLDPGHVDYSIPYHYQYSLHNNDGSLLCDRPILPFPSGCPGNPDYKPKRTVSTKASLSLIGSYQYRN